MSSNQPDLEKHGVEDELKGKGNQSMGWLKKTFGKLTGNRKTQIKGTLQEFGGQTQAKGGRIEQKIEHKLEQQDQAARGQSEDEQI